MLELQSCFTGGFSQSGYAAMVQFAASVENDGLDLGSLGLGSDFVTDPSGLFGHGTLGGLLADSRDITETLVCGVINQLCRDMQVADEDAQARTLGGTAND